MQLFNKHSENNCYRFLILFVALFCITSLLFIGGCSGLQKPISPADLSDYHETGIASYYAQKFHHRKTASGQIFKNDLMTAAHLSLPFGTRVVVKNLRNGKSVKVTINDRGPFIKKRIIDLSRAAFAKIENLEKGLARVEIKVVEQ